MISRRSFLSMLACLPIVGKFVPTQEHGSFITRHYTAPLYPETINWTPAQGLKFHPNAFEFVMRPLRGETSQQIPFAEWDRKYQS